MIPTRFFSQSKARTATVGLSAVLACLALLAMPANAQISSAGSPATGAFISPSGPFAELPIIYPLPPGPIEINLSPFPLTPKIPVLITRVTGYSHGRLQRFLFTPEISRNSNFSEMHVYASGEVEITEISKSLLCTVVPFPPPPFWCGEISETHARRYVDPDRVRELSYELARIGTRRQKSEIIDYSSYGILFSTDTRDVTYFHPKHRKRKSRIERDFFGPHAVTNTFAYRTLEGRTMLIEAAIQKFLTIVAEEGRDSIDRFELITGDDVNPIVILH